MKRYRDRRNDAGLTLDLSPFLGVLVCLLGSLLLILSSIVVLTLGADKTYAISPDLLRMVTGKNPHVVVWDGMTVQILPEEVSVPWDKARVNDGRNDTAFGKLLGKIEGNKKKDYLLVAVRPSGFHNFREIHGLIGRRKFEIGYEPLPQKGRLVLADRK